MQLKTMLNRVERYKSFDKPIVLDEADRNARGLRGERELGADQLLTGV